MGTKRKGKVDLFMPARPPSPRVHRISREIQRVLSDIFIREEIPSVFDKEGKLVPFPGPITVTDVKVSQDLLECNVWVRSLGKHQESEIVSYFNIAAGLIRKVFAAKSKMRFVPHFHFNFDDFFEKVERLDNILKKNKEKSDTLTDNA
ncbi:MAG: 30S ribosome-binding factor RbfA [Holosporales bacterium]|jgi:ribosome-binding factor A|nr:30S ribosome-binding factor RbfA [Holosporales bacterium]